jgi:hypothetical protein
MTSPERVYALRRAVEYAALAKLPGAIVECGVWRGGSMMASALTLLDVGRTDVELYLFDTFEGMPPPSPRDVDAAGEAAATLLEHSDPSSMVWAISHLDEVRAALASVPYPPDRIHFVEGRVEETIPSQAPAEIAVLRLDTDWYESTKHELVHLYPRLVSGGVLIIDDYGHWRGAREATDEYLREHGIHLLLNRIDYTGRVAVKP